MWRLAVQGVLRWKLRAALILGALAIPAAVLLCLSAFGSGYERRMHNELERMGVQLMLVPIGCPYDAAARVVKGQALDNTLPEAALEIVRKDPDVALAAPLLITAFPRPEEKRTDLWVGLDPSGRSIKPWWKIKSGTNEFPSEDSVILGAEAAAVELRRPGDLLFNPEANRSFVVAGVLERSGTSDDNLVFLPLRTAQSSFAQPGRLTAIAIRLHDPDRISEVSERLQQIPGAQVVTLTEMMGVFLNVVGAVRLVLQSITLLAVGVCALGVFNTLLAAVLERTGELALLRAVGASRWHIFGLVALEAVLLALASAAGGVFLAAVGGGLLQDAIRSFLPLDPGGSLWRLRGRDIAEVVAICVGIALLAGLYPAWRASRIQPATAAGPNDA